MTLPLDRSATGAAPAGRGVGAVTGRVAGRRLAAAVLGVCSVTAPSSAQSPVPVDGTLFPPDTRALATPAGIVVPVVRLTPTGALVRTPCSNLALVQHGVPLGRPAVVLDPGHGGDEPGATGPNGVVEKDLNLDVARRAQAALERDGYPTVLTRTADYRVTLDARGDIAGALRPAAFVSIHHNAAPDGPLPVPGTELYHQITSRESRRLGGVLYEEVVAALGPFALPWVGAYDAGVKTRRNSRGLDYYGIVRRTAAARVVGVLAELAYLSNGPEADALRRDDVRTAEAEAVARGVERFLTTRDPGSGYVQPRPRRGPAGPGGGRRGCVDPVL